MNISKQGKAELCGHEGLALKLYLDSVNVRTIGLGATVSEIPNIKQLPWTYSITIQEAFDLLDKSLSKYVKAVNDALKVPVTQFQFDALVSICYNIGTSGLKNSTFMRRINAGARVGSTPMSIIGETLNIDVLDRTDTSIQQEEILTHAYVGGGTIVEAIMFWTKPKEITNRRKKEAKLFATGKYSNNNKCLLFPVSDKTHKPIYNQGTIIDLGKYL
jgi:GH24 family phage-related lysozyme (muramidase)